MLKCIICDKDLTNGIASAKKENGDYYVMCRSCGNVHYVRVLENGLTEVERTSNEDTEETRAAMKEAAKLFKEAGVGIMEFKVGIHSDKTSAKELDRNTLTEQEMDNLTESYKHLPSFMKEEMPFETYLKGYEEFKEKMESNPDEIMFDIIDILKKMATNILSDEDDCDCDNCDEEDCPVHPCHEEEDPCEGCCGCDECDDEDEEEQDLEDVFKETLPVYVVEGTRADGKEVVSTADSKEELNAVLSSAEKEDITVTRIRKVKVTLTDIEYDRETTVRYRIND